MSNRRLLGLAGIGIAALVVAVLVDRPPGAAQPVHRAVRLERVALDGVPFERLRVRLASVELVLLDNPTRRPLAELARAAGAIAAWNGGFFEPDFKPSGLLVDDGLARAPLTSRGGSGVWVARGGSSRVIPAAEYSPVPAPDLAVQCGPILLEGRGRIGIRTERGPEAARTAICIPSPGEFVVYVTWSRITLHRLARILLAERCDAALNLDGGPSTGLWVGRRLRHDPRQPVRTAIAVVPLFR